MTWVLINRKEKGTPHVLKTYRDRKGALIGMRASNRNAGWTRVSLCSAGIGLVEWAAKSNGLPVYDYAPYMIAHQHTYSMKYGVAV